MRSVLQRRVLSTQVQKGIAQTVGAQQVLDFTMQVGEHPP
jgi:hypothetical protein